MVSYIEGRDAAFNVEREREEKKKDRFVPKDQRAESLRALISFAGPANSD